MFELSSVLASGSWWLASLFAAASVTTVLGTLFALFVAYSLYEYAGPPLRNKMRVFREMGVPYMPPLRARMELEKSFMFGSQSFVEMENKQIEKYGKLFGKVDLSRSLLMVAEPELLRDIFVKEFNNFYNRRDAMPGSSKLLERSLFFERDKRWREIRALVTPTFSSAKMRNMDGLIWSCLKIMQTEMEQRFTAAAAASAADGKNSEKVVVVEIDAKNYFSNFAMDVIGTVFFGVGVDAITNREHPFVKHSFAIFAPPSFWRMLVFFMMPIISLRNYLVSKGIIGMPLDTRNYFENIIPHIINDRRKIPYNQQRQDFLNVLINAREKAVGNQALTASGTLDEKNNAVAEEQIIKPAEVAHDKSSETFSIAAKLNDDEIAGQCFIFMIAGFETTATTIGFLFHELAMNQDVQDRLRKEINNAIQKQQSDSDAKKSENELAYDSVAEMALLDACINETLRLYPPVSRLERECMQDCTLSNGLQVKKGVLIGIPAWYIQRSAENFADPDKFDPDRFYDSERRAQIKPYTYMPFGQGPRNCVGMRFALLELKMVTAFVVRNYRIVPTAKTVHPIPLQARTGALIRPESTSVGLVKIA